MASDPVPTNLHATSPADSAPPRARREPAPDAPTLGSMNGNPAGMGFWELLREDFATHGNDPLSQGFWALAVCRFGNWRMDKPKVLRAPMTVTYHLAQKAVEVVCGVKLSYTVKVGRRVHLWHFGGMVLGAREIGDDVQIRQNTTMGVKRRGDPDWKKPIIGSGVDIGTGAVIVGPIEIGDQAQIGANSVVMEDVPAGGLAVGVPARVRIRKA
jgi:serine O-acetyltransferase